MNKQNNRILFAVHLNQAMAHLEAFYRDHLDSIKEDLKVKDTTLNRATRKSVQKANNEIYERIKKRLDNLIRTNYRFLDEYESNLSESSVEVLESIGEKSDKLIELSIDNSEDMSILLGLYSSGKLNDFLKQIKQRDNVAQDTIVGKD